MQLQPPKTLLPPLTVKVRKTSVFLLELKRFTCSPPPSLVNLLSLERLVLLCRLLLDGKDLLLLEALAGAVSMERLRGLVVHWNFTLLPPRHLLLGTRDDFWPHWPTTCT
jgi:hypothetical protein